MNYPGSSAPEVLCASSVDLAFYATVNATPARIRKEGSTRRVVEVIPGFDKHVVCHGVPGIVNADKQKDGGCDPKQRVAHLGESRECRKSNLASPNLNAYADPFARIRRATRSIFRRREA